MRTGEAEHVSPWEADFVFLLFYLLLYPLIKLFVLKSEIRNLEELAARIQGEVETDPLHRIVYATDASAYREMPLGVVYPKNPEDIREIVRFARETGCNLIPRAAGTSLAGQVVGPGLVVDISRYMNRILELNEKEHWVRVEPGVVLDELHLYTKPFGLFFGPETSTSNRCCLGGMVGNNSCGLHSLVYGSTRDHLLEATVVLSDGSVTVLKGMETAEVEDCMKKTGLEGKIYRTAVRILRENAAKIKANFPDPALSRRNMGYALDQLLYSAYFDPESTEPFNLCKLLAGSEGTLAFATELKLNLLPLPPKEKAVICVHCRDLEEAFQGNLVALRYGPMAVELMDRTILELSKKNIGQRNNRFFIEGDPGAILIVEVAGENREETDRRAARIEAGLREKDLGYAYPRVYGKDISRVWSLRKAGLGLLSGMPGNAKPVSVVEDTAVTPERLPAYMKDFGELLNRLGLSCVYHAHIATGELHLRPILNLKEAGDRQLFRQVAEETALLVKKHRGSLSGEHGDGRLRGEFIPLLFGESIYRLLKELKHTWDPAGILNRGKIVETPAMDEGLRYEAEDKNGKREKQNEIKTYFDFSAQQGWLCAIEQCNGSGDCRKAMVFGGTMCPSYRATRREKDTTRARANVLRELLSRPLTKKIYDQPEISAALDTCLSCKACKSECPSNVDMARFKAEYLQHRYDVCGVPVKAFLIAHLNTVQRLCTRFPFLYNGVVQTGWTAGILKRFLKFAPERTLPLLDKTTLRRWVKTSHRRKTDVASGRKVYLFADEFTDYMDVETGICFVQLLEELDYEVIIPRHVESGRTSISKGLLKKARRSARRNVELLKDRITEETPLVGIEPSCILSFRDEYPDLVGEDLKPAAVALGKNCLLYDEFLVREIRRGRIGADRFTDRPLKIWLHGHCHQKSLASVEPSREMLSLPRNYVVEVIPSGCCGMAGAFGYERAHYALSMQIGEQVLFPAVRQAEEEDCIAAPGTSCRQQIQDGTGRIALHPVEILFRALK